MTAGRIVLYLLLIAAMALGTVDCVVHTSPGPSPVPPPRPAPPPPPPSAPPIGYDVGLFYDELDPFGDWVWVEPHGWVWLPGGANTFWRPYTVGRWVWTDWGWTWVSNEVWGWAVYHYGRWVRVPRHGWAWVPGTTWGPAWVAWRHGGGVIGWAPLPPQVTFRVGVGIDLGGVDLDIVIHQDTWCFVDIPRFVEPDLARWAYPVGRNTTVLRATTDSTRIRVVERRVVNEGVDRHEVERVARRAVPVRRLVDAPTWARKGGDLTGTDVRVFRPEVRDAKPDRAPGRGRKLDAATDERQEDSQPSSPVAREEERRWDRGWLEDWRKLQKVQKQDELEASRSGAPRPKVLIEQHREENYQAAENARREQLAARERAKRKESRAPAPADGNKKQAEKPNKRR